MYTVPVKGQTQDLSVKVSRTPQDAAQQMKLLRKARSSAHGEDSAMRDLSTSFRDFHLTTPSAHSNLINSTPSSASSYVAPPSKADLEAGWNRYLDNAPYYDYLEPIHSVGGNIIKTIALVFHGELGERTYALVRNELSSLSHCNLAKLGISPDKMNILLSSGGDCQDMVNWELCAEIYGQPFRLLGSTVPNGEVTTLHGSSEEPINVFLLRGHCYALRYVAFMM